MVAEEMSREMHRLIKEQEMVLAEIEYQINFDLVNYDIV